MDYENGYDDEFANQDLIHIHKVNTRGRKCETRVVGIPDIFDYKKMLKFWKNVHVFLYRTSRLTDVFARKESRQRRKEKRRSSNKKTTRSRRR
jgi:hypothetical protein